jgi:hypothetical protein
MIRTISTLTALLVLTALAQPAGAQQVRVSLAGKDDQAIRADVHKAAIQVCNDAFLGDHVAAFQQFDSCVAGAESRALSDVKAVQQAPAKVASLGSTR